MKRLYSLILLIAMLMVGCGKQNADVVMPAANQTEIANPWEDVAKDDILHSLGFDMLAPDGSRVTAYRLNQSEGIGEITFKYGEPELEYTYRMKSSDEFEDISGMNYQWDVEADAQISWCEAKTMRAITEEKTVDVCLWYDVVPGVMYSLSTEAADLDGFDITAIAGEVFKPLQGDAGEGELSEEEAAEMFMPSNFLEAKLNKDVFDSYDEIIDALDKDNAYAKAKIYGSDDELLLITDATYDYGDGTMAAMEVSAYADREGAVKNIGNFFSGGTAYPVSIDDEGKVYTGNNSEVSVGCISDENANIMLLITAYVSYAEDGSATYGGFIRSSNSFEAEETTIAEDDSETLDKLFADYQNTKPIAFTVVE